MANFTVYLSPIEPTTIESTTVSSAFTQEDGKIAIPMLLSSAGNSNINIEILLRKTADNYIFAVFDPGTPYISWERTYISFDGGTVSPSSSITITFKNPGNDRRAEPYSESTVLGAKNPNNVLEHFPFILKKEIGAITKGEIPDSSSDVWNKTLVIDDEFIETQPIVRPGEYVTVKWYMYVNGESFITPSMVVPYETPLFTGGWITAKTGTGVDVKYSVEVFGSLIDGIMPTDFYDYQVGKWVYLMKNVNLILDENKNFKQMYGSSNITLPNSTLGELEDDVSAATERDLAAKDAVINPIPPNEQQINTAGGMAAAVAAVAAAAIVEAAAAAAALIEAETALANYDPAEEVNTKYRIVPFNFKGPMNVDCAVPYEDAIDIDSATNFEEVFDMVKYEGTITSINNDNDTAIVNISGIGNMTLPIFYYCDGTEPSIEGGSAAFSEDDLVVIEIPNNDWNEAKIIGFPNEIKECSIGPIALFRYSEKESEIYFYIYYDLKNKNIFNVSDIEGNIISQPIEYVSLSLGTAGIAEINNNNGLNLIGASSVGYNQSYVQTPVNTKIEVSGTYYGETPYTIETNSGIIFNGTDIQIGEYASIADEYYVDFQEGQYAAGVRLIYTREIEQQLQFNSQSEYDALLCSYLNNIVFSHTCRSYFGFTFPSWEPIEEYISTEYIDINGDHHSLYYDPHDNNYPFNPPFDKSGYDIIDYRREYIPYTFYGKGIDYTFYYPFTSMYQLFDEYEMCTYMIFTAIQHWHDFVGTTNYYSPYSMNGLGKEIKLFGYAYTIPNSLGIIEYNYIDKDMFSLLFNQEITNYVHATIYDTN